MPAFLRHIVTGEIREVELHSEEFETLRLERNERGFPVWEQTSGPDAKPELYASPEEIASREKWGVQPLSDVTADGVPQSVNAGIALGLGAGGISGPTATAPTAGQPPAEPAAAPPADATAESAPATGTKAK